MTIRDADRFKDKIELSLDNRQVFFVFFGGAVIASLVFVLGVMVGKRLEARDRVADKADTSAAIDPLAALDELAADEEADDLAFENVLIGDADEKNRPLGQADMAPTVAPAEIVEMKPERKARALAAAPAKEVAAAEKKAAGPPKFTLQLSSFQDRDEATTFVDKIAAAGYEPYIVRSDVPDRGVFYRVRLGHFPEWQAALDAKTEFEKRQHIIAYVTRL